MNASVVIASKNRIGELRSAISSALSQSVNPQIIVIDDGSTDGTSDIVRRDFPSVLLVSHEISRGYIVRRNEGAELANGEIIFSIDDDAVFSAPDIIEETLLYFDDRRIAAVAIPYREPLKDNILHQSSPSAQKTWLTNTFIGTAHAINRDIFLQLGGYRENLVHQGEEDDLAIRLLDAGFMIVLGCSSEILHYESPKRDFGRMDFYGARNQLLWVWCFSPLTCLPLMIPFRLLRLVQFALSLKRKHRQYAGIRDSFLQILKGWPREPVSLFAFLSFFRLKKRPQALL
ncbi:MAG: glycosyltransferase family A protein [Balneolales bacterium]